MSLICDTIDLNQNSYNPEAFLSLDIGGSAGKAIYRDKDSPQEVRCLYASRDQLDDLVTTLKEKCVFPSGPGPHTITTCGIGCTQFLNKLTDDLNVKINNINEIQCFVKTIRTIVSQGNINRFCYTYDEKSVLFGIEEGKSQFKHRSFSSRTNKFKNENNLIDVCKLETYLELRTIDPVNMYPCAILMLGSATGFIELEPDGNYACDGGSTTGGKAFLGMGKMLLQIDSYEEILQLAKKGRANAVDTAMSDLTTQESAVVSQNKESDFTLFPFGKVTNSNCNKRPDREDIAAAFVKLTCNDLVDWVYLEAIRRKTRNVFVCGGFAFDPYIRDLMTSALIRKRIRQHLATGKDPEIQFYFMKNGNVFGALGAFLQT